MRVSQGLTDDLDDTIANPGVVGADVAASGKLPRTGERFSLTIRRVAKTQKSLLRLAAK
jgi:hypothetical protein